LPTASTWPHGKGTAYFRDVGSPTAYRLASVDAVTGALPAAVGGDRSAYVALEACVDPSARLLGGSSVHRDVVVERDAVLEESVVLPGARVGAGSRLVRCVVPAGAEVRAGTHRRDALLSVKPTDQ
jgi:hypothetical protein